VRRILRKLRALWLLAKREHATPRELAWAVGVGVFVGCSPWVGFHGGIAVALATLLRLNRLWTFLGSRVATFAILVWIAFAEVELGHRLRTGRWAPIHVATALEEGRALLVDWVLGSVLVGALLGVLVGGIAYAIARRRARARERDDATGADLAPSADHAP
jgi:uncharacterized protein (DUF2062 family)